METLVWTRGRCFPLSWVQTRLSVFQALIASANFIIDSPCAQLDLLHLLHIRRSAGQAALCLGRNHD
jgi:hypothetical protein